MAGPSKQQRIIVSPFKALLTARPSIDFNDPSTYYESPFGLLEEIDDFDRTQVSDVALKFTISDRSGSHPRSEPELIKAPDKMS